MYSSVFPLFMLIIILKTGGTRSGELSFRAQRMSLPMLETLRLDLARVSLYFDPEDKISTNHLGHTGAQWYPRVNEFVQLRAKVTNLICMFCCMLFLTM